MCLANRTLVYTDTISTMFQADRPFGHAMKPRIQGVLTPWMSGFMASGRADVRPIGGRAQGGMVPAASSRRPMGPNGPDGRFAPTERWTRLRASGHRGDILVVATIIGAQHALLTVAQRAR